MEITIKIDQRSKQAKAFLAYLKTLPFVSVESRYNAETEKVIDDARKGIGLNKAESVDDLMAQLNG